MSDAVLVKAGDGDAAVMVEDLGANEDIADGCALRTRGAHRAGMRQAATAGGRTGAIARGCSAGV
eukprot:117763-Chlamydomonas_euryale.AAC.2